MSLTQIPRDTCVFTGKRDLEHLHTFRSFPIFMGCTEQPFSEDLFADMSWFVSRGSGSLQLNPLLPLEILYGQPHNEAIGGIWQQHHDELSQFVRRHVGRSVLEIGGANGLLAQNVLRELPQLDWTLLEPNPRLPEGSPVNVVRGYLTRDHKLTGHWDTVVHSHVLEHAYQPLEFLTQIRDQLPAHGRHVFSFPNMKALLQNFYTNCLNFEHTCFLDETFLEWSLEQVGFGVIEKRYFKDHSIFYATAVIERPPSHPLPPKYDENRKLFKDFVQYNQEIVNSLNVRLQSAHGRPVYLFGAHVFSQFLLSFGLESSQIVSILDNGPTKIGKRLYGTRLTVQSPSILKDVPNPVVILKAANYNEEIKNAIIEQHNSSTTFWE